jgi:hypothetical protein
MSDIHDLRGEINLLRLIIDRLLLIIESGDVNDSIIEMAKRKIHDETLQNRNRSRGSG